MLKFDLPAKSWRVAFHRAHMCIHEGAWRFWESSLVGCGELCSGRVSALLGWEARNVPAVLSPNVKWETIEARAGSGARSSLGAGGETGA